MPTGHPSSTPAFSTASGPLSAIPTGFSSDARRVVDGLAGPQPGTTGGSSQHRNRQQTCIKPCSNAQGYYPVAVAVALHMLQLPDWLQPTGNAFDNSVKNSVHLRRIAAFYNPEFLLHLYVIFSGNEHAASQYYNLPFL